MPLDDHSVYGDIFPGFYHKCISDSHLAYADHDLEAVAQHGSLLGSQPHQALECVGGATLGHGLQHLSDGDERGDHGRRLKVKMMHGIVHDLLTVAEPHIPDHEK